MSIKKVAIWTGVGIALLIFMVGPAQAGHDVGGFISGILTFLQNLKHH